jgi:shikimate dehydrogenase
VTGPRATTRLAAVIGRPVRHSLSPVLHNAAFEALGLDWAYVAFEPADGAAAVSAMRTLGIEGLSVTMPFKGEAAVSVDELTPEAEALGAVNCVSRHGDRLIGHNTDGDGFVDALTLDEGWPLEGRRCVIIGAGGAGRAVAEALGRAGASEVVVVNRDITRARAAAALAGPAGRVGVVADVADAELVVNATPVGMVAGVASVQAIEAPHRTAGPRSPLDVDLLRAGQLVVDLIYEPAQTALLAAARERGAAAVNGIGMLIHQAAHAFRIWTGEEAPTEVMSAAAVAALAARDTPTG